MIQPSSINNFEVSSTSAGTPGRQRPAGTGELGRVNGLKPNARSSSGSRGSGAGSSNSGSSHKGIKIFGVEIKGTKQEGGGIKVQWGKKEESGSGQFLLGVDKQKIAASAKGKGVKVERDTGSKKFSGKVEKVNRDSGPSHSNNYSGACQ